MNTMMLTIGLFILIPSLMYFTIYYGVNAAVLYQKIKTKTSTEKNINSVKENQYNVPQDLLKRQSQLKDNLPIAQLVFIMGLFMVGFPLLYQWWEFLKDIMTT